MQGEALRVPGAESLVQPLQVWHLFFRQVIASVTEHLFLSSDASHLNPGNESVSA
jgi:hypothetical protein